MADDDDDAPRPGEGPAPPEDYLPPTGEHDVVREEFSEYDARDDANDDAGENDRADRDQAGMPGAAGILGAPDVPGAPDVLGAPDFPGIPESPELTGARTPDEDDFALDEDDLALDDNNDLPTGEELPAYSEDLLPGSGGHTEEEIHRRRIEAHRRHRRNGRIRLLVLVLALALVVAFIATHVHLGSNSGKGPLPPAQQLVGSGHGKGYLSAHSQASVLPANVVIADRYNHRVIVVSPQGQLVWSYPNATSPPTPALYPDYAFVTPSGREIMVTEDDHDVIYQLDVHADRVVGSYGHYDRPGSRANYLYDPSSTLLLGDGDIVAADILNCRVVIIAFGTHHVARQIGTTGRCVHDPPKTLDSPDSAFPASGGDFVINEVSAARADLISSAGNLIKAVHPPGFGHPSSTNLTASGDLISVDHTNPGEVETFSTAGKVKWRYKPRNAAGKLDDPAIAFMLRGGFVIVSDEGNDRVVVIDPLTDEIVWQYGHTGVAGSRPGYLDQPVGIDLAPPYSLVDVFAGATPPS